MDFIARNFDFVWLYAGAGRANQADVWQIHGFLGDGKGAQIN